MEIINTLLADALFSAIAATGFAVISNPPRKAVLISALLSAIGHSFRCYMTHYTSLDIATATFFAAFTIGMLSFAFGKLIRCPSEVFTFPSLLPMIPGMYAYNMFLSLTKFIRSDSAMHPQLIEDIFKNGLTAVFIMLALVVGVSLPTLLFHKQSYMMSRGRRG
ncbi:MAG: threonine/serine exporter family protein [Rikenellaceae bacterium]